MTFPEQLKYSKEHEWVRIEGDTAYVGITEFAQRELGDIVYVDITTVGQSLGEGDIFGTVEAVKTVSDLFMPIAGEVLEVNSALSNEPELVNAAPYEKGWIVKVKITNTAGLDQLLTAEAYKKLIGV